MVCAKKYFLIATMLLVSISIASSEERPGESEERLSFQGPAGNFGFSMGLGSLPGLPSFSQLFGGSNASNPFEFFLSAFKPNFVGSNGTGSLFSSFFPRARLEEIHAPESDDGHEYENPQSRLFFGLLSNLFVGYSTPTSCNYTTRPGLSCLSCTQRLQCFSGNVGRLTRCSYFRPYCNSGYCSRVPGAACLSSNFTSG